MCHVLCVTLPNSLMKDLIIIDTFSALVSVNDSDNNNDNNDNNDYKNQSYKLILESFRLNWTQKLK